MADSEKTTRGTIEIEELYAAISKSQERLRQLGGQFQEAIRTSGVEETFRNAANALRSSKIRETMVKASEQLALLSTVVETTCANRNVVEVLKSQKTILDKSSKMLAPALTKTNELVSTIGEASLAASLATTNSLSFLAKIDVEKSSVARWLESIDYHTKLALTAQKHFAKSIASAESKAYVSALDLTSRSLLDTTDMLGQLAVSPVVNDGLPISRLYNVGQAIVRDHSILIAEHPVLESDRRSFSELLLVKMHSILRLIVECNQTALVAGKKAVFKPTTQIMKAFADAPMIIATNSNRLADLVDCLYIILYEGAGKDNLRYLISHSGYLEPEECEAIWTIKALRNKWLRHDPDHGNQAKIRNSWADLKNHLHRLGVCGIPNRRQEFMHIQMGLLSKVEEMLYTLLSRMKSESGN